MGAIGNSATYQFPSSKWKSESIALLRETGHQTWECKGEKGISASQKWRRPEQVTMDRIFDEDA